MAVFCTKAIYLVIIKQQCTNVSARGHYMTSILQEIATSFGKFITIILSKSIMMQGHVLLTISQSHEPKIYKIPLGYAERIHFRVGFVITRLF